MEVEKPLKNPKIFGCKKCNYFTCSKKDYNKHLTTRKHEVNVSGSKMEEKNPIKFICKCSKQYANSGGLWKHKQKCNYIMKTNEINENTESSNNIILLLFQEQIKENKEFKELIIEQNKQNQELQKQLIELANKQSSSITNHTTNNNCITNHNRFNLNFFLNEKCKDALNIMEFVQSLQIQLSDLEQTGKLGFAEGISKIFIRGLKELDVCKRPIHCSDLKREVLYVKNEDKWEKENVEKQKIKKAINHISHKNINQIPEWVKKNPTCKDSSSKKSDEYLKMLGNSMCGIDQEETEHNFNKIISNVAKEVLINKEEI